MDFEFLGFWLLGFPRHRVDSAGTESTPQAPGRLRRHIGATQGITGGIQVTSTWVGLCLWHAPPVLQKSVPLSKILDNIFITIPKNDDDGDDDDDDDDVFCVSL